MIFLAGGPPHQDMFDMKPDAPDGIRGEYQADPDQRPRARHLRAHAAAGEDDGQVRGDPLAGGRGRRPLGRPVPDRLQRS